MFFIRENEQYEKHEKNNNYSENNITMDIDQDPINHLLYLIFKPVTIFKSSGSLQLQTSHLSLCIFNS